MYEISSERYHRKSGIVKYNGNTKVKLDDVDIKNLIQMFTDVTSMVKFEVEVWEKITKPEMHEMFVNFNLNESINNQDHRNHGMLICHTLSETFRVIMKEVLQRFGFGKRSSREDDWILQMYKDNRTTLELEEQRLTSGELDKYWENIVRKMVEVWMNLD